MSMNFCIVGGDLRNFFLAKLLAKEKNEVKIYGFDKLENFKQCEEYSKMLKNSNIIIFPIPYSKDNIYLNMPYSNRSISISEILYFLENKIIFAGNISEQIANQLAERNNKVIDFMKKEEFAILNAIPTAEATIEIILKNMKKVIQNSNCLVMGFGRIGKILANKLNGLSVKVTCVVSNECEKAWAIAYGYEAIIIKNIQNNCKKLKQYDIIINTIPKIILKEELKEIRKETLIIDLASKPYGIDRQFVKNEELNFIEALGLPRKISTNNICKIFKRNYTEKYIN